MPRLLGHCTKVSNVYGVLLPTTVRRRGPERVLDQRTRAAPAQRGGYTSGSALRLRQHPDSSWEAAFTADPGHPVARGTDMPTWISMDAPSKREALLRLWRFIDDQPDLADLRRNRVL